MLTTIFSPSLMKSGTLTTVPVSMVASLEPPVAVSPLTPGVVWVTVKVIFGGT